jgi:hypothetical protein
MPDAREEKAAEAPEEESASARRKFKLVVAALLGPGFLLMLAPEMKIPCLPVWPPLLELFSKFGDAMVIAAILAVAVDSYVKRTLVSEVAKDAIDFAVGYALPGEIKTHLVEDILRLPCARRKLVFHYKFQKMPAVPPKQRDPCFQVTCFTSYEIENLTDRLITFKVRTSVPKSHLPGLPPNQLCRLHLPAMDTDLGPEDLKELSAEQAEKNADAKYSPYITATKDVNIRPGAGNAVPVETVRVSYHRLEDSIFLDLLQPPSLGLDLIVTAPQEYAFDASFGAAGDPTPDHKAGSWSWKVPGVHLPGSHIYMSWYRLPPPLQPIAQISSTVSPTPKPA